MDGIFLITGGVNGIGAKCVTTLLEEGAQHVAVLDVDGKNGKYNEEQNNAKFGPNKIRFFKCDVSNEDELFHAYDETVKHYGRIDCVINNAAIAKDDKNNYKKTIDVNFTGLVSSTLKALELMGKNNGGKGGCVINISSIAALRFKNALPIYASTKAAILHFNHCFADEIYYSKTGVRIITMCFGSTDTTILDEQNIGFSNDMATQYFVELRAEKKLQSPESAAKCVVEAYKHGRNGDTFYSAFDKPAVNITQNIVDGNKTMGAILNQSQGWM